MKNPGLSTSFPTSVLTTTTPIYLNFPRKITNGEVYWKCDIGKGLKFPPPMIGALCVFNVIPIRRQLQVAGIVIVYTVGM